MGGPVVAPGARPKAAAKAARPAKAVRAKPRPVLREVLRPAPKAAAKAKPAPAKVVAKPAAKAAAKPAPKAAPPKAMPTKAAVKPRTTPKGEPDLSVAGQIYQRGKLVPGVLHIDTQSGRIVRVAKSTELETHLDFGGSAILPGAIDLHVHFREPGHTHKEDFTSGSTSAAFGGVTGFVDMPNTLPATVTLRAVKDKLALAAQKSVVDYAVWAGGSWYTGELPEMLKRAAGIKTYLGATTGDLLLEDAERLRQILTAAGVAGKPVVLHAESQRVLQQMRRTETGLADHDTTRPPLAEVEAIYDAMKAVAGLKKPPRVHIAHIASADAVQAATAARFSMGACPHHLLLDTTAQLSHAYGKMNPPLRSPDARKALWKLFTDGKIPILESDHAPHTQAEKEDNFHAAPSGVPGVETMLPLMLAQAKSGKVELQTVVDAVTLNPAKLLGLTDRGALEPGMRADFAVFDLKAAGKLTANALHSKCGWTPFEGHSAILPSHTYLAGHPIVQDGELVAQPGTGKSMLPQPRE
ncbi:MAG: dihydroorotase [Thermoplasmata archaeon]|nr:dihydroorotase [Thermoplasmata archaeon]